MKIFLKNALRGALVALATVVSACSSPNQAIGENGAASPASAAQMALMTQHDSLMAETAKLYEFKAKLTGYHTEAAAPYIHGLLAADGAMRNWMYQYKPLDSTAAPAARLAYFQQQQQVLARVSHQYRATLDSATRFTTTHPAPAAASLPTAK